VRVGVPLVAGWLVLMPAMGLMAALAAWRGVAPPASGEVFAAADTPESVAGILAAQFPWG
jgi:hypothetical protein